MRVVPILLTPALLAACVDGAPSEADLRVRQEAACTSVIAAHIGRPQAEVATRWLSEAQGIAQVEAVDGTRRHVCDVDATGRVLRYTHPGA